MRAKKPKQQESVKEAVQKAVELASILMKQQTAHRREQERIFHANTAWLKERISTLEKQLGEAVLLVKHRRPKRAGHQQELFDQFIYQTQFLFREGGLFYRPPYRSPQRPRQ